MFSFQNDLNDLEVLIKKWRGVSQEAMQELWELAAGEPKPTLTDVVDHFQIDHAFIGYNAEDESFSWKEKQFLNAF